MPDRSFRTFIRPYRHTDRAAVRRICCETAFRNLGARAAFEDETLFADYWTCYYTDHDSSMTWVAESGGEVVGYLTGCRDTKRHVRVMAARIVPRVLASAIWRLAGGRYRQATTRRYLAWVLRRSWREIPAVPLDIYPAHYHINVARAAIGERLYTRLGRVFAGELERLAVTHVHGVTVEPATGGAFRRLVTRFLAADRGARVYMSERPTRFGRDVLGVERALVNRAFGFSVHDFTRMLIWGANRYGM